MSLLRQGRVLAWHYKLYDKYEPEAEYGRGACMTSTGTLLEIIRGVDMILCSSPQQF